MHMFWKNNQSRSTTGTVKHTLPTVSTSQWADRYVRLTIIASTPNPASTPAQARPTSRASTTRNAAVLAT